MKPDNLPHNVKASDARDLQARGAHTDKADQHTNDQHDNGPLNKESTGNGKATTDQAGLNTAQQQFVLKFCRQLASVIQACDQSESAEIEVGRRLVGTQQIKVKLSARREN